MEVPPSVHAERPLTPDADYSLSDSDEGVHVDEREIDDQHQPTPAELLQQNLSRVLAGIKPNLDSLVSHDDESSLIEPKKVVTGAETRDQKEITRQLKWNQDRGIDVLYQNELQKSFQKRRETVKKKEQLDTDEKLQFERTIQMQASKLKNPVNRVPSLKQTRVQVAPPMCQNATSAENEFQMIHSRIAQKSQLK